MPYFRRMVFMKTLEPSICAPARSGPQTRRPSFASRSVRPAASGASGPTTVRSIFLDTAKFRSPSRSSIARGTHSAWRAIPGLPGAA